MAQTDNLINATEAGEILGVDDSTMRRLALRRRIPFRKVAGRYLFDREKIKRYALIYQKWDRD